MTPTSMITTPQAQEHAQGQAQDFGQYIGLPYQAGAQGPHAYDCMAFFRHVQAQQFGVQVPQVLAPDPDDQHAIADLFSHHPERARWQRLAQPVHGCAVLIHRPMHIGVWLAVDGGGVLHCARGAGVLFTPHAAWACSGFGRREYFAPPPAMVAA